MSEEISVELEVKNKKGIHARAAAAAGQLAALVPHGGLPHGAQYPDGCGHRDDNSERPYLQVHLRLTHAPCGQEWNLSFLPLWRSRTIILTIGLRKIAQPSFKCGAWLHL